MRPNIHLIGIQGSGKGTQSALLVKRYNFTYLGSGNLLRERSNRGDQLGNTIASQLKAGNLLPNKILFPTIRGFLDETTIPVGLLADGVLRTIEQVQGLHSTWKKYDLDEPILIHLRLDQSTAIERIEERKKQANLPEKSEYHKTFSGKLIQRTDDNPKAMEERFAIYHKMTQPVIGYFKEHHQCDEVDAGLPVRDIHQAICQIVEKRYPILTYELD